jgi:hypothetical protein
MARLVVQGYVSAAGLDLASLLAPYEYELVEVGGETGFTVYADEAYDVMAAVVELHGGKVSRHLCTHGDPEPTPCVPNDIMAR